MDYINKIDDMKELLRLKLTDKRYEHSLNVSKKAVELGKKYNADISKCEIAGLLHDIMKNSSMNECLQIIEESDILLDNVEKSSKSLWHSIAGYAYVKNHIGIKDEEILNAIRYHTCGRANMSLVEKIVFVADMISDDRCYDDVDLLRNIANTSLDEAIKYSVCFSIINLVKENKMLCRNTIELYNSFLNNTLY